MNLTADIARKLWDYDSTTGHLVWKASPRYGVEIGTRAGCLTQGYWRVKFNQKNYKVARIAWLLMTGEWPVGEIDHIDGDMANDRFCNLRDVPHQQNCFNRRGHGRLGIKGVTQGGSAFIAQICLDGRNFYLGSFKTALLAKNAYDYAAAKLHGKYARS